MCEKATVSPYLAEADDRQIRVVTEWLLGDEVRVGLLVEEADEVTALDEVAESVTAWGM